MISDVKIAAVAASNDHPGAGDVVFPGRVHHDVRPPVFLGELFDGLRFAPRRARVGVDAVHCHVGFGCADPRAEIGLFGVWV